MERVWFNEKDKRSWVEAKHKDCNRTFSKRVNDFKSGYLCPYCALEQKDSKLTVRVKEILNENNIEYQTETSIKDIHRDGKNYLLNDFNLGNIFIEVDGEQHFMQKQHRDPLEIIRERDITKDNYYFENRDKYTFLRIPYTEERNVNKIVNLFLSKKFNSLRLYRVMIISKETIINYENQEYYEINKKQKLS